MAQTNPSSAERRDKLEAATYRVPAAAKIAGVSERTLWRLIDSRQVPGVLRFGRCVRISRKLFDEWLGGAK